MTSTPLKLKLGRLIKSGLQAGGLRQLDLAKHLHVSTSAVSQMLSGKTAPAAAHLDKIFQLLNCSRNQVFIMRDLLARIRSGMHELHSPVNEFIRATRKERGLSMSKLAQQSGIAVNELRLLETCSSSVPSEEQISSLVEILKFDEIEIQQLLHEMPVYDSALGEVQEQNAAYGRMNPLTQVPVISVENMLKFNPALEDIKNFIWRNYDKVTSMHNLDDSMKHDNIFSIVDSGDNFTPPLPGTISLIVALKKFPETNDAVIVKTRNCDKLQLRRFVLDGDNVALKPFIGSDDLHKSKTEDIEWVRKVLRVAMSAL